MKFMIAPEVYLCSITNKRGRSKYLRSCFRSKDCRNAGIGSHDSTTGFDETGTEDLTSVDVGLSVSETVGVTSKRFLAPGIAQVNSRIYVGAVENQYVARLECFIAISASCNCRKFNQSLEIFYSMVNYFNSNFGNSADCT